MSDVEVVERSRFDMSFKYFLKMIPEEGVINASSLTKFRSCVWNLHTDYYREVKHRYKIEARNSELKNLHGYGRANAYGIENMQMQGAMAIFTVNLKRILKMEA